VHVVVNSRPGPTSKADCLNTLYEGMYRREQELGEPYMIVAIHDAEDVLHPLTLRMYNHHIPEHLDMAQLPVLPLEGNVWTSWVRNTYLDEFCESHLKDMTVREEMGGVVPSAGVGTAFHRDKLAELRILNGGTVFPEKNLTEDYVVGLQFSRMGCRTGFLNRGLAMGNQTAGWASGLVYVREYFPSTIPTAIRQRGRWILGIVFQSWESMGWFGSVAQHYTLYRDRRAPLHHLVNLAGYTAALNIVVRETSVHLFGVPPEDFPSIFDGRLWLWQATVVGFCFLAYRLVVKAACVHHIYGWKQACFSVARNPLANVINFLAACRAMGLYFRHKISNRPLAWNKTTHQFPGEEELESVTAGALRKQT